MARKPKPRPAKGSIAADKEAQTPSQLADKDLLVRMRQRYTVMSDADDVNRTKAIADLRFLNVPGEQWDAAVKSQRGERPCYEFNKTRITAKRIINDMRSNRPAGKVRATEDADVDTANVYEGLIRNIWNCSDADTVIDYAAEYQVGGGMGAWRVNTAYSSNSSFDQDILIEPIKNPFCLYCDPHAADPMKLGRKTLTGQTIRERTRREMALKATSAAPYNRISGNGLCTTLAGLIAAALGYSEIHRLPDIQKTRLAQEVRQGHLLLSAFNALQPGV